MTVTLGFSKSRCTLPDYTVSHISGQLSSEDESVCVVYLTTASIRQTVASNGRVISGWDTERQKHKLLDSAYLAGKLLVQAWPIFTGIF